MGYLVPENWERISSDALNEESRRKIAELFTEGFLPKLDRAGRDQIKLVTNITELARAFIGEVTTTASRRLERIFALKICQKYRNKAIIN